MPPEAPIPATPPGVPPSTFQSSPNLVAFDPKDVVPTQSVYLQRNDAIAFTAISNITGNSIKIDYRWLTPEGEIKEGETVIPPFTGNATVIVNLYEGWLLSFSARLTGAGVAGGWTWLAGTIIRPGYIPAAMFNHALLWGGFIYGNVSSGWPGTPAKELTDGPGVIRTITGSTPAAGADINEVVPSQRRWLLLTFQAALTTSVAVANRVPIFFTDDGANILFNGSGVFTQAASLTQRYNVSPVIPSQVVASGAQPMSSFIPLPLRAGFRIKTVTSGIQPGDQWTAPQYSVLEWGSWDN